jgi:excisionase family DNA binding protein
MSAEWLTATEAAARANRHVVTIRRLAEEGSLHGHQSGRGGRWLFKPESIDAYVTGQDTAAACGCARLRMVKRVAS